MSTRKEIADEIREYAAKTHEHVGLGGLCKPWNGDRCDITAALMAVAARVEMGGRSDAEQTVA